MSAGKLAKLQDEAYRRAVDRVYGDRELRLALFPPGFNDDDEGDDWAYDPNWR